MAILKSKYEAIIIGASAGGFEAVSTILLKLPQELNLPVILIQHLPANDNGSYVQALKIKTNRDVKEAEDKELIEAGIYAAPAAYHLLMEANRTFSLSQDIPVYYSRPSIDVSFESASDLYGDKLIGILLTGANEDGARGLLKIQNKGGLIIVENPETAQIRTMPGAGLRLTSTKNVFNLADIADYIKSQIDLAVYKRST